MRATNNTLECGLSGRGIVSRGPFFCREPSVYLTLHPEMGFRTFTFIPGLPHPRHAGKP